MRRIERYASLSFAALARWGWGEATQEQSRAARAVLAATALLGDRLAFAAPSIFLRSGCSLVPLREELAWVGYGGSVQSMELGVTDALGLFELAVHRADEVGFPWMTDPVLLEPGPELARLLEKSFFAADDRSEPSGAD